MPKTLRDTRERILALERILQRIRRMTVPHMIEELHRNYGIEATRRTIEQDLDALTVFLPIEVERVNQTVYYHLMSK